MAFWQDLMRGGMCFFGSFLVVGGGGGILGRFWPCFGILDFWELRLQSYRLQGGKTFSTE